MPTDTLPTDEHGWNELIGSSFPDGLTMGWIGEQWVYIVPSITVEGMEGDWPQLAWPIYRVDKWFHLTLRSWKVVQDDPHLLVRVTFENEDRAMLWNAKLSGTVKKELAADRADKAPVQ